MGRYSDDPGYMIFIFITLLIIPLISLALVSVPAAGSTMSESWAIVSGDPQNTFRSSSDIIHTHPRLEYLDQLEDPLTASSHPPVISTSGDLYIVNNGSLRCYKADGLISWSVDPLNGTDGSLSGPALTDDGGILVYDSLGFLHKFDTMGKTIWTVTTTGGEGSVQYLYPIISDDRIYITGPGNRISCHDISGSPIWNRSLPGSRAIKPAVLDDGSIAVTFGDDGSGIICLDVLGKEVWRNDSFSDVVSGPMIDDDGGVLVVMWDDTRGSSLFRYHANGSLDWTADLFGYYGNDLYLSLDRVGNIIVAGGNNVIQTFHISGSEIWNLTLSWNIIGPCTSTNDDFLIVPSSTGLVVLTRSGEEIGEVDSTTSLGPISMDSDGTAYSAAEYLAKITFTEIPLLSQIKWMEDVSFLEDDGVQIDPVELFGGSDAASTAYQLLSDYDGLDYQVIDKNTMRIFGMPDFNGIAEARVAAVNHGSDGLFNTSDDQVSLSNLFRVNIASVNDPPILLNGADIPDAVTGEEYTYQLQIEDVDSDVNYLTIFIRGIDWLGVLGHTLYSDTTDQGSHNNDFDLIIIDSEGGRSENNLEINVVGLNTPPYVTDYNIDNMVEDTGLYIEIKAYMSSIRDNAIYVEDEEGDIITFEFEPGPNLAVEQDGSRGFTLIPADDFFGDTKFGIIISDGELDSRRMISIYVRPDEDNVRDVKIVLDTPLPQVRSGKMISLSSTFIDPDIGSMYQNNYDFEWFSDIDGEIGTGTDVEVLLSPGLHNITLNANKHSSRYPNVEAYMMLQVGSGTDQVSGGSPSYGEIDQDSVLKEVLLTLTLILITYTLLPFLFIGGQILWNRTHSGNQIGGQNAEVEPIFKAVVKDRGDPP